jgi:H+/gluconate symporter-like permease
MQEFSEKVNQNEVVIGITLSILFLIITIIAFLNVHNYSVLISRDNNSKKDREMYQQLYSANLAVGIITICGLFYFIMKWNNYLIKTGHHWLYYVGFIGAFLFALLVLVVSSYNIHKQKTINTVTASTGKSVYAYNVCLLVLAVLLITCYIVYGLNKKKDSIRGGMNSVLGSSFFNRK